MSTDLILYQEKISQKRAKRLFKEFKHAWDKCSNKEKFRWCKDTIILFGKVTFRRGKGLLNFTKNVFKSTGKGISNFGKAINENQTKDYLSLQKNKLISGTQSFYKTSKKVLKNTLTILKNNPKQSGPILFLGVLGFFCGAGFQVGEKAFYDIDGGIPDLDIAIGGIGTHRSPLTHSIIAAAVIETMVFSTVRAAHMIYKHLPESHDLFWE